ncbi:barstar family protein [Streptomyces sp. NBC_01465]|uniref:barstar family protein n=1 Tax=Streptomyces sp. NBC_01465 TaxID=2903878 RepID=UPI002E32C141|nr:barstar family protein [Streptomyces sp. NBC_01465]
MTPFDVPKPKAPWVVFGPRETVEFEEQALALRAAGGRVYELQARDLRDEVSTCEAFARAVGAPGYFGWNWDALVDCLDDLHDQLTGGVGIVVLVHGADELLGANHLRVLMSSLCLAADRTNTEVDSDGEPRGRPVVIEHFLFLLDEVRAEEFKVEIEDPDLAVAVEGDFLTVALNLTVWRPSISDPRVH